MLGVPLCFGFSLSSSFFALKSDTLNTTKAISYADFAWGYTGKQTHQTHLSQAAFMWWHRKLFAKWVVNWSVSFVLDFFNNGVPAKFADLFFNLLCGKVFLIGL